MSALRNLEARLDRLALTQLREVAAQQAEEIDRLREQLANAERRADWADQCAEMWQDDFLRLQESLDANQAIGMTKDGALHLISTEVTA